MKVLYYGGVIIFLCFLFASCRRKETSGFQAKEIDTLPPVQPSESTRSTSSPTKEIKKEIYGDTVWVYPYGNQVWYDTLSYKNYTAYVSVWVDATDYLIDTVRSAKGNRIVIGYNHYYSLDFRKDGKQWFFLNFNKREDLHSLLYGTDLWRESNLNTISNIVYNEKFESIIVEMSLNSGDEFNNMFYMVSNTEGKIKYLGTISSWGGGGPDGSPFLTKDGRMYVTCNEIYNFMTGTAISLTEYASIARLLSGNNNTTEYIQIHALRNLKYNNFLVVFNRFHHKPKFNALILNTDSLIVGQFGYYGLVEDIDAVLLYEEISKINKAFLYDTEREVLISITEDSIPKIQEKELYEMTEIQKNEVLSADYQFINFGFYASYEFYFSPNDTTVYFSEEELN